jgi:pimeloyl-ACP methyl ester carboxylesterase
MLKILALSLVVTTACATSDERVATSGGTMSANNQSDAPGRPAFVTSEDGTRIAFEKIGSGPALVVVGGALSQRDGGKPLASKLADEFTVYTYDRRGRGDSGDTKPYAVAREIDDLGAVIEQAGDRAYVYGASSGAALALQAAAELGPAHVSRLAVFDTPYGQEQRAFDEQKEGVERLVRDGEPGEAAEFFLSAIGTPPQALEGMKSSPEWAAIKKIDFTLAYDYAVLGDGQVPDNVKRISVPTLVMNGEKSLAFMGPTADRIAELIPNAERQTLKGQAHQAAPDVMAPLLIDFFGQAHDEPAGARAAAR